LQLFGNLDEQVVTNQTAITTHKIGGLREWAVRWAIGNGPAILAVGAALTLLLSWRARLLDDAATLGPADAT
jgi:hypothetical protein